MLLLLGAFAVLPLLLPWLVGTHRRPRVLRRRAAADRRVRRTPRSRPRRCSPETFRSRHSTGSRRSASSCRCGWTRSSWVMALIVTGVGALVMLYCRWYFRGKTEGVGQFSAVLLAFAGAMYGLVLTDDLVVLVMFWEITSVLSYLLIGYYNRRAASRRAALQALLVTIARRTRDADRRRAAGRGRRHVEHLEILAEAPTGPIVDAALVLLLVGALSKSAIFPFHFWLPGAMAAPTPVSAYLHAAAMVKAGIYLIALLAPVFAGSPAVAPDRRRARRVHDAARRAPGAARERPQAHPRVRHGEPARLPHRRPRLSAPGMPRSPGSRC